MQTRLGRSGSCRMGIAKGCVLLQPILGGLIDQRSMGALQSMSGRTRKADLGYMASLPHRPRKGSSAECRLSGIKQPKAASPLPAPCRHSIEHFDCSLATQHPDYSGSDGGADGRLSIERCTPTREFWGASRVVRKIIVIDQDCKANARVT